MGPREFKPSIKLANDLEQDHYQCARMYFRDRGTSDEVVKECKNLFRDYDKVRDKIVEDMKQEPGIPVSYVEDTRKFCSTRALEIIDVALEDHKEHLYEPTKSNQWRRA